METDDLEPQQYKQLYLEESIPVKDVRQNALRKFVYIGSILCIGFIIIGFYVKFPDQIELPFIIKSDKSEDIYRFPSPVYVIEKYCNPGNQVSKGQSLIKITSPDVVNLINSYSESEQNLQNFEAQKKPSVQRQREMIGIHMEQSKNKAEELKNELSLLDSTWKSNLIHLQFEYADANKKFEAYKKLYDSNIVAKFTFSEYERRKVSALDSLTSAKQSYDKIKFNLNTLTSQCILDNNSLLQELNKLNIDTKYDSVSLNNQFELVKNKIKNTYGGFEIKDGFLILKANEAGTVSYIFDGEKEVGGGTILMKIIYTNSSFYSFLVSPPSSIGKIEKSQKVFLKVASFPFYEWGTLRGHIDNLSLTPDEKGNFSVKVIIDDTGRMGGLLQIGMDGKATIVLREETFFYYFFRNTKEIYSKATMGD